MSLPAPNLDDRKFQDIVDEAKRLIPKYCPEWTNHNVSDPGVALIELFAWMSEMVLFRLNQVPDRLYVKFLNLVGIEPFPPSVATVDLSFWLSAITEEPVVVPKGTQATTPAGAATGEGVVFSTVEDLVIAQPSLFAAKTSQAGNESQFVDVWDDLRHDDAEVTCFSSSPLQVKDAFYLGFANPIGGTLMRLAVFAQTQGIGVKPPDPPIQWDVWTGDEWQMARVELDSTGGLNRDGQIVLALPRRSGPLTIGESTGHWLRCRLVEPSSGQEAYKRSPQLKRLKADVLAGTVLAEHSMPRPPESLGRSVGVAGQVFTLANTPVLPRNDSEVVQIVIRHRRGEDPTKEVEEVEDWTEVSDFASSSSDDRHYTVDGASGIVRFGPAVRQPDGRVVNHGAIPPDGAEIRITGYRQGGGAAGNVGSNTLTVMRTPSQQIDRVSNLIPAEHGADGETVDNAKVRGPMSLRTGERAVTTTDFERIAQDVSSEIARVRCLRPTQPDEPVRLLVVPKPHRPAYLHEPADFALSDQLVGQITAELEPRRILGTTIKIEKPRYRGVLVATLIQSRVGSPVVKVAERARELLYTYINPVVGGNRGEGWPYLGDLSASRLSELLEAVEGVDLVEEVLLYEYDLDRQRPHGPAREALKLERPDEVFLSAARQHQVLVR